MAQLTEENEEEKHVLQEDQDENEEEEEEDDEDETVTPILEHVQVRESSQGGLGLFGNRCW